MKSTTTTILIAAGALLVGGVATAAFMNHQNKDPDPITAGIEQPADADLLNDDAANTGSEIDPNASGLQYADVLKVDPVRRNDQVYATVLKSEPISETSTTNTPHEVCEDVVVQERLPERDGNVGGTVVGAVVGGLLGHQVGGGNGRKLATVAGAAAGGLVGNRVDRNHVGGKVVNKTERQCHTETSTSQSSHVVGYTVTYRNPDGSTGSKRMDSKPGSRIAMGTADNVVGYDVTYRYQGVEKTIRMQHEPSENRLPVVNGQLVTQTESATDAEVSRQ